MRMYHIISKLLFRLCSLPRTTYKAMRSCKFLLNHSTSPILSFAFRYCASWNCKFRCLYLIIRTLNWYLS